LRFLLLAALAAALTAHHAPTSPRTYAHQLATAEGWNASEWWALDWIVTRESGWDPCAVNPSRHECGYTGANSCGIPQAQPCPWRGRLWSSRFEQVRWLVRYVKARYRTPARARAFWLVHRWY
jgi:hypothetical protein